MYGVDPPPRPRRLDLASLAGCSRLARNLAHPKEVVIATPVAVKKKLFNLISGRESQTVHGRENAVATAKELSQRYRRPVSVESTDGSIKMQFSGGGLQTYRMETGRH